MRGAPEEGDRPGSTQADAAALRHEIEELRQAIALLQKENEGLRRFAGSVRDLVSGFSQDHTQVEAQIRERKLQLLFDPAHAQVTLAYLGRRAQARGQLAALLHHAALAAAGELQVDEDAARPCFHWTWAFYLFPAPDGKGTLPTLGSFRRQVTELNHLAAELLTGDPRNRAGYLLEGTGWRAATYAVRLGSPDLPLLETNLAEVDVLLAAPGRRDPNLVSEAIDRCERAIRSIQQRFRGDRLALAAADQIGWLRDRFRSHAAVGRDPWLEDIAHRVAAVQSLRDYWTLSAAGPVEATVARQGAGEGLIEHAPALHGATQAEPEPAPQLLALCESLERSVLTSLTAAAQLDRRAWAVAGDAALFAVARQAQPDRWVTAGAARDYFFAALCAQLANDDRLDRLDPGMRERLAAALWARVFPTAAAPSSLTLLAWTAALAAPSHGALRQPEPFAALRADWEANRRRYQL